MTPLAALVATGAITQQQYLAGEKFSEITGKYLASIGAPDPGGTPHGGARSETLPSEGECRRRKEAYLTALDKLDAKGARVRMSVTNIAVYEQAPVDDWDLESLRIGLTALL